MSALPSRASLSGTPTRATANTAMGQQHDFLNERLGAGTATAAEKAASRTALETARGMQPVSASVASNALTLTLNPTNLEFRSATLGSGTVNMRTVSAAINLVISSGSTLGTSNGVASRIAVLAIDNAGTVELAAVNLDGGFSLDESTLVSTTAEGGAGAADSISTIYSTTSRSNLPFRVVGFVESTQSTAGTWATAPSKIQGAGGSLPHQVKATMSAVGAAPMFACRAWVNFNGTGTLAVRGSGNVSSVTDNGTGTYTMNFSAAMPDVNFCAVASGARNPTSNPDAIVSVDPVNSAGVSLRCTNGAGTFEDFLHVHCAIFR